MSEGPDGADAVQRRAGDGLVAAAVEAGAVAKGARVAGPRRRSRVSAWSSLLARVDAGERPRTVLVGNPDKPSTGQVIERITKLLAGRADVVGVDLSRQLPIATSAEEVDFFIVIGGDGTLLGAARNLQFRRVPLIGVHLGHLGFLTAFTEEEFPQHLDALLAGELPVDRRITLECCIKRGAAATAANAANPGLVLDDFSAWAINECVLTAGMPFKMIRMRLYINGQPMVEVMGDGVIIATPGGSTAYNLSAGGPLVDPSVRAIVVSPLNPHSITHKPAVIDDSGVIEVVADRVNPGTTCLLDGQIPATIHEGDRVIIKRGRYELLLARNPTIGDWQALQDRLHWGRMPSLKEVKGKRS